MSVIAIVDDIADNRLLLRALLGERYTLVEYDSGGAALEGLRHCIPDLVLLDAVLPAPDAAEVIARIRADVRLENVPVLALSSGSDDDRERLLALGVSDYMSKPITDEQELQDRIARLIAAADRGC